MRAPDGRFQSLHGSRVGPGDDEKIRIASRLHGRRYFLSHLRGRHEFFAGQVAAPLRHLLIFQLNARDTRTFKRLRRPHDLKRWTVAGVRIREGGNVHRLGDVFCLGLDFLHREQPDIGKSASGGHCRPGNIHCIKPRSLDLHRRESVEGPRHHYEPLGDQFPQAPWLRSISHGLRRLSSRASSPSHP